MQRKYTDDFEDILSDVTSPLETSSTPPPPPIVIPPHIGTAHMSVRLEAWKDGHCVFFHSPNTDQYNPTEGADPYKIFLSYSNLLEQYLLERCRDLKIDPDDPNTPESIIQEDDDLRVIFEEQQKYGGKKVVDFYKMMHGKYQQLVSLPEDDLPFVHVYWDSENVAIANDANAFEFWKTLFQGLSTLFKVDRSRFRMYCFYCPLKDRRITDMHLIQMRNIGCATVVACGMKREEVDRQLESELRHHTRMFTKRPKAFHPVIVTSDQDFNRLASDIRLAGFTTCVIHRAKEGTQHRATLEDSYTKSHHIEEVLKAVEGGPKMSDFFASCLTCNCIKCTCPPIVPPPPPGPPLLWHGVSIPASKPERGYWFIKFEEYGTDSVVFVHKDKLTNGPCACASIRVEATSPQVDFNGKVHHVVNQVVRIVECMTCHAWPCACRTLCPTCHHSPCTCPPPPRRTFGPFRVCKWKGSFGWLKIHDEDVFFYGGNFLEPLHDTGVLVGRYFDLTQPLEDVVVSTSKGPRLREKMKCLKLRQ
eukprot:PhF_6_TR682/c0_g1_i2/m.1050